MTKALEQAEIDQGVGEGVGIGDGIAIAEVRAFDAKSNGLAVDAFGGRALRVDFFVGLTVPIERVAQTGANAGGHGDGATSLACAFMVKRTGLFDEFGFHGFGKERTNIFAALMFNDSHSPIGVRKKEWHR